MFCGAFRASQDEITAGQSPVQPIGAALLDMQFVLGLAPLEGKAIGRAIPLPFSWNRLG